LKRGGDGRTNAMNIDEAIAINLGSELFKRKNSEVTTGHDKGRRELLLA